MCRSYILTYFWAYFFQSLFSLPPCNVLELQNRMVSVLFIVVYLACQIQEGLQNSCGIEWVNGWMSLDPKAVCQDTVVLVALFPSRSPRPHYSLEFTSFFSPLFPFPSERGYHSIVSFTLCYCTSEVTLCHFVVWKEELSNWFYWKNMNSLPITWKSNFLEIP